MPTHGKCGKLPARPGSIALKYAHVFNAAKLPTPPMAFGHQDLMPGGNWFMLGNDIAGNCFFAGSAHEHMLWTMEGGAPRSRFTIRDVMSDYSALTGYVVGDEATDTGTDMQIGAKYRQDVGVVDATGARHKIKAYIALQAGNVAQVAQAAFLLGAVGIGLDLPDSAETQFDEGAPWSIVPGAKSVGGHYVPLVGRTGDGNFIVISWGKLVAVTPDFLAKQMDEGVAYLSDEILNRTSGLSPENYNEAFLNAFLEGLHA